MQPLSLYDIDRDLELLEAELIDGGGEVDDETEIRHNDLLDAREDKWRAYAAVIRRLEASHDAVKEERTRLQQNEKALDNAAKRMKARLIESMDRAGVDSAETPLGKLRVQEASQRSLSVLLPVDELPVRFVRTTRSADNGALREALDAGDEEALRVAELLPPTRYVRIY
jgi:hypothetical protein